MDHRVASQPHDGVFPGNQDYPGVEPDADQVVQVDGNPSRPGIEHEPAPLPQDDQFPFADDDFPVYDGAPPESGTNHGQEQEGPQGNETGHHCR